MSDRTYFQLTCRKEDMPRFEIAGLSLWDDYGNGTVAMVDEERDWADTDSLPKDTPYFGFHGAGVNYGAGAFACDGTDFEVVECGHDSTYPTVRVQRDGSLIQSDVDAANRYWGIRTRAERMLEPQTA